MTMLETRLFSDTDRLFQHRSPPPGTSTTYARDFEFLCKPAFTEAVFVASHSDAFSATIRRLYEGAMELDPGQGLRRTASHHSNTSSRSQRSQTVRIKSRKYASYTSSRASSTSPSDKSLVSFPSFSPESPKDGRHFTSAFASSDGSANTPRKTSAAPAPSMVDSLTTASSHTIRNGLFDDDPIPTTQVPGSIHQANDEHIERLIARNGAVALVRQIAEDLAQRDAQIATIRRKTEERERALRKIILECGLSSLDLETRLRAIEDSNKDIEDNYTPIVSGTAGLESLINAAMGETLDLENLNALEGDATIRALLKSDGAGKQPEGTARGWKDYIWGSTNKKGSQSSSVSGDAVDSLTTIHAKAGGRRTVLQNGVFSPPETGPQQTLSRSSSFQIGSTDIPEKRQSTSLASLALRLVAGNNNTSSREDLTLRSTRGRTDSTSDLPQDRTPSTMSARTTLSTRSIQVKSTTKETPGLLKRTLANVGPVPPLRVTQDRWDSMGHSPQSSTSTARENFGPVEMDTILPPDAQPPTLTHIYNNNYNPEFLTDRFGFIYDQRRKKRQREASESMQKSKGRSRVEMLSSARGGISPSEIEVEKDLDSCSLNGRPDTPVSNEEPVEDDKPAKRWHDYLKIATFPTELLSHTPSGNLPTLEVLEGDSGPSSPGIMTEDRGFLPTASTTTAQPEISAVTGNATISKPTIVMTALSKEDVEPVKLLLAQLGEVHDSLQRDKTVKWNDFLRKVRAERKREGEAAAAALAASAETRSQRAMTVMPEVSLADGEMIGVAGLGNKGKIGRAKWNEFKALVLGGIPVAYRAKIWAECSGATALRVPGYYDDLVANRDREDDPIIVSQIQMDINRTLTDNIFFRRGPGVQKLNEVLLAYSRRNAEVGYCQGMNLITACLLLIMPTAEDAFWVLTSVIENILPRGYYDHSLLASRADQQVLRQYVTDVLPRLSNHLEDLGIELEALTFQWFLSVFTDCLSAEALFRVWDVVLSTNDGSTFLFQVALALLKLNEQQLLAISTPAGIYTYINHQMTNHAISIDGLIHASEGLRKVVKRDDVEARRARAIEAEKDLIRQREERNNLRKVARLAMMNGNGATAESVILQPEVEQTENKSVTTAKSSETAEQMADARNHLALGIAEFEDLTSQNMTLIEDEASLTLGVS